MWESDCEESWAPKNWCFWTVVLEKTLDSPLDCKEIQPVHPKGEQSWVLIGRIDVEAETPILWPPHAKSWLIGKDLDAGRDWGQEEKGTTEDEMAGWHHWFDGHEFEWTPGVGDGQGGLACCDSWGHKESDMTEQLNWTDRRCMVCLSVHVSSPILPPSWFFNPWLDIIQSLSLGQPSHQTPVSPFPSVIPSAMEKGGSGRQTIRSTKPGTPPSQIIL